jgi:protein gp37
MAENTAIEWADHTFNPWEGCQKVGPGCDHCYAETRNARYVPKDSPLRGTAPNWGPRAPRRRTSVQNWRKPLHWQANAAAFLAEHGRRQRVFCASLADVFDNHDTVLPKWRQDLFELIRATPDLDWLLVTKRIGNAGQMIGYATGQREPPDNVWLGATIVNQEEANRDIPKLLATPAKIRFLSMEPLIGHVDLTRISTMWFGGAERLNALTGELFGMLGEPAGYTAALDWNIVGGESGEEARTPNIYAIRSLRDQCAAAGKPFLFKQWGEWGPVSDGAREGDVLVMEKTDFIRRGQLMRKIGKHAAGRLLDGRTHDGFPS